MGKKYILSFDSGTTSCRSILYDHDGNIVSEAHQEFPQIYPKPGWVEHNPMDIWSAQYTTAQSALSKAGVDPRDVSAIGITNQRETTIIWDRHTGVPIYNAICWQSRQSADICDELKAKGLLKYVRENTGLLIDAYFSGSKIKWILDHVPGARKKAENGDLAFGTVDSWLIWKLTGGKAHVTDYSNASRTMLFNIHKVDWDPFMLDQLEVPRSILPMACESSQVYGVTEDTLFGGAGIPIASSIGDQQAALFGQACFSAGMAKVTYGTGGTLMMNTGIKPVISENGLLASVAWGLRGKVEYSMEGLLYVVGAAVQWLRDEMRFFADSADSEYFAGKVSDTNGVYFVPAFVGMSAPYWDQYARGAILGLTRGAGRNHIIRATIESMAYQIRDVLDCMEQDSGIKNKEIKVDGGACRNSFLLQFQSDILNVPVLRPKIVETTSRGAAFLAGLATGFWKDQNDLISSFVLDRRFEPSMDEEKRTRLYKGWQKAVQRVLDWEEH